MTDRGRDTSPELTQVRTVLGRAEFSLGLIGVLHDRGLRDPDQQEMVDALEQCVALLSRWRRTGRPLKSKGA